MFYEEDPIVSLQFEGEEKPLILIHPISGTITGYMNLAQFIEDRPVYAIQATGPSASNPATSLEELACQYLGFINKQFAVNSFHLGGWSLGGVIAYEMAQQLRLTDRPLDRVIMIDSFIPEKMIESQKRGSIFWFLKDIESSCKTSFSISLEEVKNLGETELLSKILNSLAATTSNTKSQTTELVKNLILNYYRLRNLANNYKPTQFNGRAFLLQADENQENQEPARDTNGWQGLVQELLTFKVPGNHFSIVKGENARVLATKIKSLLSS